MSDLAVVRRTIIEYGPVDPRDVWHRLAEAFAEADGCTAGYIGDLDVATGYQREATRYLPLLLVALQMCAEPSSHPGGTTCSC